MKILVFANCQQVPISSILRTTGLDSESAICPIHLMTEANLEPLFSQIQSCDILVIQRFVGKQFFELGISSDSLKKIHNNVLLIPNAHFSGYHPTFIPSPPLTADIKDFQLLLDKNRLGPYVDMLPLAAIDYRVTLDNLATNLQKTNFPKSNILFNESIQGLKDREIDCDILISDWIEYYCTCTPLFYSFNHPVNSLFAELCKRILFFLKIDLEIKCRIKPYLSNYRLPIYPAVSSLFNVSNNSFWPTGGGKDDYDMKIHTDDYKHLKNTFDFFQSFQNNAHYEFIFSKWRKSQAYMFARKIICLFRDA